MLKLVDDADFGKIWKVEKRSPFLEQAVVQVMGQC